MPLPRLAVLHRLIVFRNFIIVCILTLPIVFLGCSNNKKVQPDSAASVVCGLGQAIVDGECQGPDFYIGEAENFHAIDYKNNEHIYHVIRQGSTRPKFICDKDAYAKVLKNTPFAKQLNDVHERCEKSVRGDYVDPTPYSGGAYVISIPDVRRAHEHAMFTYCGIGCTEEEHNYPGHIEVDDIRLANFFPRVGTSPTISYRVNFVGTGKYTVAVMGVTAKESDSIHVGLNDVWDEHGEGIRFKRKGGWSQILKKGGTATINVKKTGPHWLHFGFREDGTGFDKWVVFKGDVRPDGPEQGIIPLAKGKKPIVKNRAKTLKVIQ